MTIAITIGDMPVELRVTHYLPPEPPRGLCGYGFAAEVEWIGPDWLHAIADHFDLWRAIDKLVLDAVADRRKQGCAMDVYTAPQPATALAQEQGGSDAE